MPSTTTLAASALALSTIRYVGAAYLLYLGVRTILSRHQPLVAAAALGGQGKV